jgi:hypothetical protein
MALLFALLTHMPEYNAAATEGRITSFLYGNDVVGGGV